MQDLLREWGQRNAGRALPIDSRLLDQYHIDWFHELNRALSDQLDDDAFATRITDNVGRIGSLAAQLLARARETHPGICPPVHHELLSASVALPHHFPPW